MTLKDVTLIDRNSRGDRPGKIKVNNVDYHFTLKKTFNKKMWALIEICDIISGEHINHIMVPKNLCIGAPFNTGEDIVCLLMKELKPDKWFRAQEYVPNKWRRMWK